MTQQLIIKNLFLILVFLAVFFEVVADVIFKQWSINHRSTIFAAGMVVYLLGTALWAFSLKYEYLAKAGAVFTLLNLVALTLIGLLFYKEDLSLTNKVGIGLAIVSIILIEI
jgi:multidrug transporter EmrE-like cation transporter